MDDTSNKVVSSEASYQPLCRRCAYIGDKYSFPMPNDLPAVDAADPTVKCLFCCCGDYTLYGKEVTWEDLKDCEHFDEL